jgi:hypothetical protein
MVFECVDSEVLVLMLFFVVWSFLSRLSLVESKVVVQSGVESVDELHDHVTE